MTNKINESALNQLFVEARTVHGFLPDSVSDEQIHELYEIMKWGPTSLNSQPARYVFLRSKEAKARLIPALNPGNVPQAESAPLNVIIAFDSKFFDYLPTLYPASNPKATFEANPDAAHATAFRNGSLQGAYLILAARALGLDCGPMSGFDIAKVNAEFFPDGRFKTNFLVNIGVGDPKAIWPRGPRLEFDEVAQII